MKKYFCVVFSKLFKLQHLLSKPQKAIHIKKWKNFHVCLKIQNRQVVSSKLRRKHASQPRRLHPNFREGHPKSNSALLTPKPFAPKIQINSSSAELEPPTKELFSFTFSFVLRQNKINCFNQCEREFHRESFEKTWRDGREGREKSLISLEF